MTTLTAEDRCDRCGAQAYVTANLPAADLLFCAHHWRQYGDAVRNHGATIHDDTPTLTAPRP